MKIVPTEVTYQPLRDQGTPGNPVTGMELHFLFLTQPGKVYQMRSTTDGINYSDHGEITFPPYARMVVTTDPKEQGVGWLQLVEQEP